MKKTSIVEREFVKQYLENGNNATRAYQAIKPNCKQRSAESAGSRMLKNVGVQELIQGHVDGLEASVPSDRDKVEPVGKLVPG